MSAVLAPDGQALALAAQRVFRSVLQAIAEPGTVLAVSAVSPPPTQLGQAQAAVALTLFDHETAVWLSPRLRVPAVESFLRFQAGAAIVDDPAAAAFALADSAVALPPLGAFDLGSDESPDRGATIIVESALIGAGSGRLLRGPGIPGERRIELWGVPESFWSARAAVCALHPRGLDFIFTSGDSLTALPRTTQTEA
jgi:alpha-D-ribose 1-methylphosphonate 5-triphosphate synthase subunit PhnH